MRIHLPDCQPMELVGWQYEDELDDFADKHYDALFKHSRVDIVRLFPLLEPCPPMTLPISAK